MKNTDPKLIKASPEIHNSPPLFTKNQLVSSVKYKDKRDALNALLSDGKSYSLEEIDKILNDFNKRDA